MRTTLFPLLLALLPFSLPAQLNELLKDPNIAWAATFETETDFRLHGNEGNISIQLKKLVSPDAGCWDFNNDNWLAHWIMEAMIAGKYKAYEDPGLSVIVVHSTLLNKVASIDTVITFDPDTYEEHIRVIRNELNPNDIAGFLTHQVIYFDKKTSSYGTRLLAIAPLVTFTNAQGKAVGKSPLAWLAMDAGKAGDLNMQHPGVIWGAVVTDKKNEPEITKLKVVKNELKTGFAGQIFQEAINPKHRIESPKGFGCGETLSQKDVEYLYAAVQTDTVITFDPATFTETMTVIKNSISPSDLKKIRLVQEWYFDDRNKHLSNRLKAIAPMKDEYDETGKNLRYSRPLFYIRF